MENMKTTLKRHPNNNGEIQKHQVTNRLRFLGAIAALIGCFGIWICSSFADAPPPVLTISRLGSNNFSIVITNSLSTTNYQLEWTPFLANTNYPWQFVTVGDTGQSNFVVNAGNWNSGYFRALVGSDQDVDGVPDWMDGNPLDSSVGILSVTIDSPLNGSTLN